MYTRKFFKKPYPRKFSPPAARSGGGWLHIGALGYLSAHRLDLACLSFMPPPPPPPPPPGGGGKTYAEKKAEEAAKLLDEYAAPADFAKAPEHALTEDEKYVIENKGTERAKTGKYDKFYPTEGALGAISLLANSASARSHPA